MFKLSESVLRKMWERCNFVRNKGNKGSECLIPPKRSRPTLSGHLRQLKKTCRKFGISFLNYLLDRISGTNDMPPVCEIIRQKTAAYAR